MTLSQEVSAGSYRLYLLRRVTLAIREYGANKHDLLPLLTRDAGPIVRIGRVGKILVLSKFLQIRVNQIVFSQPALVRGEQLLDRRFLGAVHDILNHRARNEVFKEEN